jgi:hypothetical protein
MHTCDLHVVMVHGSRQRVPGTQEVWGHICLQRAGALEHRRTPSEHVQRSEITQTSASYHAVFERSTRAKEALVCKDLTRRMDPLVQQIDT